MSKADTSGREGDEMLPEYDFREGVRGKYSARYEKGSNVVVLDPDVAEKYRTSEEVNEALRKLSKHQAS